MPVVLTVTGITKPKYPVIQTANRGISNAQGRADQRTSPWGCEGEQTWLTAGSAACCGEKLSGSLQALLSSRRLPYQ
jgi:hypothetical protein